MAEAQISQIAASQSSKAGALESTDVSSRIDTPEMSSAEQTESVNQFQAALDSPINNSQVQNVSGDVRYGFDPNATQNPYSTGYGTQDNMAMDVMQNVRDKFEGIKNEIDAISNKKDFTQVDLMHLQMFIIQLSYIADLSSKTADKMSQAAQTLFRNQ